MATHQVKKTWIGKPYGTSVVFESDVGEMIRIARANGFTLTYIANQSVRGWFRNKKFKKTK